MITYRLMDASCPLPTCLHGGPIPLAQCSVTADTPAYVETISQLPAGSVARALAGLAAVYGTCGVLAVEDEQVVGKIRCYPQAVIDRSEYPCVQQEQTVRLLLDFVPAADGKRTMHLYCMQVAAGYHGQGIASGMLDTLIGWAQTAGWEELHVNAVQPIPPLLNWCGQLSRGALERRGFTVVSESISAGVREGVVAQRGGYHGDDVRRQWEEYAQFSDDEAALVFVMSRDLRTKAEA